MHRQPGVSGFPSMAGFMGEKPTKRPRMQEPQKEKTFADMRLPKVEAADEEVWEDLDDDAMDECMMLATQMCTEPMEDEKEGPSSTSNHDNTFNFPDNKNDLRNNLRNESHDIKSENIDQLRDNGFSSTRGTAHDTSRVFHNSVKGKNAIPQLNSSNRGNAFASRFNDFSSQSNSQKPSSVPKPSPSSGKVYNSIPLKGNGSAGHSPRGPSAVRPGTSKDSAKDEVRKMLKPTDFDKAKLEEDILLKQGEISVLRSELKRKEAALEAERLDRCTVIEAAEKRGREKAAAVSSEAETKIKQCNRTIEKLQDELHFKNREIQELETQCRRLELQTQQQGAVSPSQRNHRDPASQKVSPKRPSSNFKERFDFSGAPVGKKSIEVQTDTFLKESRQRPKLDVTFSRGRGRGGRQVACLFSGAAKEKVGEPLTHTNRWTFDDEWADVLSKIIADYEDCDEVQKQLLNLSIQRLEEVHVMFVSERVDALRSPILKSSDPIDVYEGHVVPPLSIIKGLTTTKCGDEAQKAIHAVCSHLPPLSVKDVVINSRIWPLVLQALDQLSRITTSQMDNTVCQLIQERLRECCESITTSKKLISLLQVLQALTYHRHFMNNLCNDEGNCFIGKLCSVINSQLEDHLMIATTLQEWLAMVVVDAPDWLHSKCSCPASLLAALLKQIHFALDLLGSTRRLVKTDFSKLLIPTIRLLHRWSTKDSTWWEKVAYLPHYTAVMGTIIHNAKEIHSDRPTVDLLCDLYECDEKIFENC